MNAIAQRSLLDAPGDEALHPRPLPTAGGRRRAPGGVRPAGRQLRLVLPSGPRSGPPSAPLDPGSLAHAAARLVAGPEHALVEMMLLGPRAVRPDEAGDAPDARLVVAPCTASGQAVVAYDGRTVIAGRGARSERLAGQARVDGAWLFLDPLTGDVPTLRMPVADARIWGEVVLLARLDGGRARRGGARRSG